jgi:iron complex transport system substrate-binding protein
LNSNHDMTLRALALVVLTLVGAGCTPRADTPLPASPTGDRVVSIGTAATETVTALGAAARLAGVDNASAEYFPEVSSLPKVGPRNALSAEGILSLRPSLVLATAEAGPPQVLDQLRGAGVSVVVLDPSYTPDRVRAGIRAIAHALGEDAKGDELAAAVDRDLADVRAKLAGAGPPPKVLFVGRGPNMPNATMSGSGTTIDEMIRLAGGTNPMRDFTGFKEMTDEAVVAAAPDVILMTERSFERSGGVDGVLTFPGVSLTPAGRARRVVTVSDVYFQGFGPGLGRATRDLAAKLHPELKTP